MSLRSYYINLDYFDNDLNIFTNSILKRIITDIRRRNDETKTLERISITRDILLQLLSKLHQNNKDQIYIHVVFSLTFIDFLRLNEIIYIVIDSALNSFN